MADEEFEGGRVAQVIGRVGPSGNPNARAIRERRLAMAGVPIAKGVQPLIRSITNEGWPGADEAYERAREECRRNHPAGSNLPARA